MMKNILLGTLLLCGMVYGEYDDPLSEDCYTDEFYDEKEVYTGAYVGAGISHLYRSNNVKISDDACEKYLSRHEGEFSELQKAFIKEKAFSANNLNLSDKNYSKIGGSVSVGYGLFIYENLYLGIDFTLDISGNHKSVDTDLRQRDDIRTDSGEIVRMGTYRDTIVRNHEIIPTLAARTGVYIPYISTLICARFGVSLIDMEVENSTLKNTVKLNKFAPIIGLSLEKSLTKNWSVKLEGDYVFPVKKRFNDTRSDTLIDGIPICHFETVKTRSYAVRLICAYHFN